MRWMMCLMVATAAVAEEPLIRMATEGRVEIGGVAMESVTVNCGKVVQKGEVWMITFPVDWWQWRELEVSLVPLADHQANLSLSGAWGKVDGKELRQELLWQEVDGTKFKAGALPEGWSSPWRDYPKAGEWPINGSEVAASWHGRPLMSELECRAGVELKLKLRVKAAVPEGFVEPKRLEGVTPAHRAAAKMKRGVNLGNCWEGASGTGAVSFEVGDIDNIAKAGFDHVRVPVGWHHRIEGGKISPEFLVELEPVLRRALKHKLTVVLNWQGYDLLNEDPATHSKVFIDGWKVIGEHFKDWPPSLFFELFNEPNGGLSAEVLNDLHKQAITGIRESNPTRILIVDSPSWASSDALGSLRLPDDDERIIASFHCYDPFRFTHQGAEWVGLGEVKDVGFDGALPAEVERRMDDALAWSKYFGRPVHMGEFGAIGNADQESRRRYARAVRMAAEKRGIPWCWWEWKAGFGCWDSKSEKSSLIEALTGS
ncbi:glycoside hydrolase family 5 protein [Haloferula sp.]|uniref:glycoside hydrolase family 5 protein n=1 Tax=Haloferula sp. TaxID=2497595 RepID=UPI00329C89C0